MIGISKNSVILHPHSEEWSILFEKEKLNIYNCIKEFVIDIQHVGSTSITGMYAKPIIDIVAAITDLKSGVSLVNDIENLGYHFKGSLGRSNRFFFWKGDEINNTHNLHIVEYGDENWENLILFRDFMNNNPNYRGKYFNLKMELASKYKDERKTYTERKTEYILSVIKLAKREMERN